MLNRTPAAGKSAGGVVPQAPVGASEERSAPRKILICARGWPSDIFDASLLGRDRVSIHSLSSPLFIVTEADRVKPDLVILDWEDGGLGALQRLRRDAATASFRVAIIAPPYGVVRQPEAVCLPRSEFSEWGPVLGGLLDLPYRTEPRTRVKLSGQVRRVEEEAFQEAQVLDLSRSGAQIQTGADLTCGAAVDVRFTLPAGSWVDLGAVVRRSSPNCTKHRYGLRFTEIAGEGTTLLADFLGPAA